MPIFSNTHLPEQELILPSFQKQRASRSRRWILTFCFKRSGRCGSGPIPRN